MERLLCRTVRQLLARVQLTPVTLRRAHSFDLAGVLLPLPVRARVEAVPFELFDAELVWGCGVRALREQVVLYFHGGGFIVGGLRTHRRLVARISAAAGAPVLQIAYRQLPVAGLEESVEDCLIAYRWLLEKGYQASQVVFAGDSVGGYLAFAAALRALAEGLPAPGAIVALSPFLDTEGADRLSHANGTTDPYLPSDLFPKIVELLRRGPEPLESLLDADLTKLPPVLIQVGSVETLLFDAELMTQRLEAAGVRVHLQIWQRQVHVFQILADLVPDARQAIREIGLFIRAQAALATEPAATAATPEHKVEQGSPTTPQHLTRVRTTGGIR
jgi:acetyl esterase/lipase